MGNEVIRPIDEDTAKAVEQTAILGQKAVNAATSAVGYLADVLGRLPHNLVGIVDDRVAHYRARRWIEMNEDLERDILERGIKERIEPSFTVLMPLLEAAIDENRAELKNLWRRLLANAYDPARSSRVRVSFIEIAKRLDPYDALVLQKMGEASVRGALKPNSRDFLHASLQPPIPEIVVSFDSLKDLGLIFARAESFNPHVTDKGALFLAAVAP
jgi:Abortive infection alpha